MGASTYPDASTKECALVTFTFNPIKRGEFRWIKWLYALRYVRGYATPRSYWNYAGRGGGLCDHCDEYHNLSVHGHIGFCIPSSPWVKAWGKAWGDMQHTVIRWRSTATFRDKFLVGKFMIPTKLFVYLVGEMGCTGAKRSISLFQKSILNLLDNNIKRMEGEYKGRPRRYVQRDWATPWRI